MRDNSGKIVVEEDRLLEVWKEHYDRISNEEFSWDREGLLFTCGYLIFDIGSHVISCLQEFIFVQTDTAV